MKKFQQYFISFLKDIFDASNSTSSKRILAFYFSVVVTFLMFFGYDVEIINSTMILIASLLGLTTIEKFKRGYTEPTPEVKQEVKIEPKIEIKKEEPNKIEPINLELP
jgi:hypothetical protein